MMTMLIGNNCPCHSALKQKQINKVKLTLIKLKLKLLNKKLTGNIHVHILYCPIQLTGTYTRAYDAYARYEPFYSGEKSKKKKIKGKKRRKMSSGYMRRAWQCSRSRVYVLPSST